MSRFDDELVRQADNAWQERGLPGSTTPRQLPYDQTTNLYLDGPFGLSSQAPAPEDEMADWVANNSADHTINVQDLDAAGTDIIGGPGSSAVYPEGHEMYATKDESLDNTLYNVYKASREIRDAIDSQSDFDFTNLFTASTSANEFTRIASDDQDVVYSVGTIAGLVNEIEDNLVVTSNYKQAYEDLQALEGYLEDINKFSSKEEDDDDEDEEEKDYGAMVADAIDKYKKIKKTKKSSVKLASELGIELPEHRDEDEGSSSRVYKLHKPVKTLGEDVTHIRTLTYGSGANTGVRGAIMTGETPSTKTSRYFDALKDGVINHVEVSNDHHTSDRAHELALSTAHNALMGFLKDDGVTASKTAKKRTEWCSGPGCKIEACDGKKEPREATNGNQETLQITDVRNLEDSGSHFTFEETITPDHVTNVLVPEEVNGEDAGYVNYYNDGSETGKTPQKDDDRNPFPFDGTNPALAPYAGTVAAVQASRERIFDALQIVERLEKLGMVAEDDRMKHVAKFEQMSDAKLAGFKDSLDMLEDSGARQPRSQKVASGVNRMPEMGRMTTASNVTRQSVQSDDWLMTLK